jgi:hypothetical protein
MKRPIVIVLLTVALTLVCLGIGGVLFFTFNGGFPTNNIFDVQNISSQVEESKTVKVDAKKPLTLNVIDDAGNVTVTGGDVETVQVKVVKTAYASTQAKADEKVKSIKYTVEQGGNTVTIKYELPKNINISNNLNTVDFIITVPNETTVDVNSNTGEVNVANIKGNTTLEVSFGAVGLENIAGAVNVTSNGGDITAKSIKAGAEDIYLHSDFGALTLEKADGKNITVTSNSGEIKLTDVRATENMETKTDFGKTTYQNGSAKALNIKTNGGDVDVEKVKLTGEIHIEDDFGAINLKQVDAGSYDLKSNGGSISIDGAKGNLKAHTDFGKITIENAVDVTLDLKSNGGDIEFSGSLGEGPHSVQTDFGAVTLTLPGDSKLIVDIKTDFGKIKSDLPIAVTFSGETNVNNGEDINGTINGGGAQLTVKTNGGNININASK